MCVPVPVPVPVRVRVRVGVFVPWMMIIVMQMKQILCSNARHICVDVMVINDFYIYVSRI